VLPAHFVTVRGGPAKPPSGYVAFCERLADQCKAAPGASEVPLDDETWQMLNDTNLAINKSIIAMDDKTHYGVDEYWTIPSDGYGDCDDYVMTKRQALMKQGVPEAALRIATVFTEHFVRHAVLTVVTDKGNYVLDNLRDEILTWDKTGYTFIERQDPASVTGWVSLE
jgi:predicted transglutaminase-like cysteine proteinase